MTNFGILVRDSPFLGLPLNCFEGVTGGGTLEGAMHEALSKMTVILMFVKNRKERYKCKQIYLK